MRAKVRVAGGVDVGEGEGSGDADAEGLRELDGVGLVVGSLARSVIF